MLLTEPISFGMKRLDTKIENKIENLDKKIEVEFSEFFAKQTDNINTILNNLASLKTMTSVLYFIVISGAVGRGGGLLGYFIKVHFSHCNQNSAAQVQYISLKTRLSK
ncbi:hypothetical protein L211DRAFT_251700 [Terfezia boudieri ATCC MYA-4762]|uniref:Uncharacterized protein n=1 Tax=Terfezia boudieri ATCC MYA-4762 TaxID=1051890 RepID=A0A3N4M4X7_9PEZI|nr:hypothetical protein L211DRAFT_251700 [Terfezia boudieri ATCC MYA-4762]